MKKIGILFTVALSALLIFSCEKDIFLDIPGGEIDPVVEGWIYNGSGPLVMLSTQFSGYGTFNTSQLTEDLNIRNAIVEVSENNGIKVQLVEQNIFELPNDLLDQVLDAFKISRENGQFLGLLAGLTVEQQEALVETEEEKALIRLLNSLNFYIDTTNTMIGHDNSSYQLNIHTGDKTLIAETTIPQLRSINFLSYEVDNENPTLAEVNINVTVPDNSDNYVLLSNRRNKDAFYIPDYLGGGLSDNAFYAGNGTIELPLLRGYSSDEDPEIGDLGLFEVGDTVTLKFQNIDQATYNFWFSIFNDGGDTPFSAAAQIQSNINGGFGVWAGYATSYNTIIIN